MPESKKPKTWSQLIEKRKKTNRNPKLIQFEDKVQAKEIAKSLGCFVPETYYITTRPETIPFEKLPKQYVVKATHLAGSKSVFLMNDGKDLFTGKPVSKKEIIKVEQEALKKRLSAKKKEWATEQIKPRIIVEALLPNLKSEWDVINDFKCYTFHGRVCLIKMDTHRKLKDAYTDYFTRDCQLIDWDRICLRDNRKFKPITKPDGWDLMIEQAEKLGKHFQEEKCGAFVRIDFYLTQSAPCRLDKGSGSENTQTSVPYFGEFTVYPGSGARSQFTDWVDKYMGYLWENPEILEKAFSKGSCLGFKSKIKGKDKDKPNKVRPKKTKKVSQGKKKPN